MITEEIAQDLAERASKDYSGCPTCGEVPAEFYVAQELKGLRRHFVVFTCMICKRPVLIKFYDKDTFQEVEPEIQTCGKCNKTTPKGLPFCLNCLEKLKKKVTENYDYIG